MRQNLNEKIQVLPRNSDKAEDLLFIKNLVTEYISSDTDFYGSIDERYAEYYKYLAKFINDYDSIDIHTAAENGYDKYINHLEDFTLINTVNSAGLSPLHLAALNGHVETVKLLLSKNSDPYIKNKQDQLPIHYAARCSLTYNSQKIINKEQVGLILYDFAPDTLLAKDNKGDTIFHYIARFGLSNLLDNLLQKSIDGLYIWNNLRRYPIHEAICNNQVGCIKYMLEKSDVVNLIDSKQRSALHYAALYGNTDVIDACFLKKEGLNVNQQDDDGRSSLHLAVIAKNISALSKLLNFENIDISLTDFSNKTAEEYSTCEDIKNIFAEHSSKNGYGVKNKFA